MTAEFFQQTMTTQTKWGSKRILAVALFYRFLLCRQATWESGDLASLPVVDGFLQRHSMRQLVRSNPLGKIILIDKQRESRSRINLLYRVVDDDNSSMIQGNDSVISKLWSYVFNIQDLRESNKVNNEKGKKPLVSLLFYLRQSPLPDGLKDIPTELVHVCDRSFSQAIRAAGELGDYVMILNLIQASISFANNNPVLPPKIFGEAINAMSQTQASENKLRRVWSLMDKANVPFLNSPLSEFELNIMIKSLGRRGKAKACLNLYRRHAYGDYSAEHGFAFIKPDAYTASTLFTILAESVTAYQKPVSPQAFRVDAKAPGLEKSLARLSRSTCWQWNAAIEILRTFRSQSQWNNHVYASLLELQAQILFKGSFKHDNASGIANAVLGAMFRNGILPDIVTCCVIIKALGEPSSSRQAEQTPWKRAVAFLREMKSNPNLPDPNKLCYLAAMSACAQGAEYETSLKLLEEMRSTARSEGADSAAQRNTDFTPDTMTYNVVLQSIEYRIRRFPLHKIRQKDVALINSYRKAAFELLLQMREDHDGEQLITNPDTSTYNRILSIMGPFREAETKSAQHLCLDGTIHSLIGRMKEDSIERDVVTYRNAIFAANDVVPVLEAYQLENFPRSTRAMNNQQYESSQCSTVVFDFALSTLVSRMKLKEFNHVLSMMEELNIPTSEKSTLFLINILSTAGHASFIPTVLTALEKDVGADEARAELSEKVGLHIPSSMQLHDSHYSASVEGSLDANEIEQAHVILSKMKKLNISQSERCLESLARCYARAAIASASSMSDNPGRTNSQSLLSRQLANRAYDIVMSLADPREDIAPHVAHSCAAAGLWPKSQALLHKMHVDILEEHDSQGSVKESRLDSAITLHTQLLRECARQSNLSAALEYADDIQEFSRGFRMKRERADQPSASRPGPFHARDDFWIQSNDNAGKSSRKNVGMQPGDWVALVQTASKVGGWRVCVNTLQFLKPYVRRNDPSRSSDEDLMKSNLRNERLEPALIATTRCLEFAHQYAWAIRVIEDWVGWSGRKPRAEAVLSAVRVLCECKKGELAKTLLNRCIQGGEEPAFHPNRGLSYEQTLFVGTVTSFHNNEQYDDADEVFITGVSQGVIQFAVDHEGNHTALDLHGMTVALAHSAVRVAMRQHVAGLSVDDQRGYNMTIVTGRGSKPTRGIRPVLQPVVQRMLLEDFHPPLKTSPIPGNGGTLLVDADDIRKWQSFQEKQKGKRMMALAAVLKNLSTTRIRQSIARTLERKR